MKIVFTAEHAGDLSAFHQLGELLVGGWALGKPKLSAGQLIELAHDAEVLVTSYDEVTDAVMAACPRLQVIACTRANPVNIDTQAAQARGIRVLYTPGRNADAAAELTLGLMLSLARHIPQSHAALKRGEFTQADNAAARKVPMKCLKALNCAIKRWGWWGMATLAAGWRVSPGRSAWRCWWWIRSSPQRISMSQGYRKRPWRRCSARRISSACT